MPYTEDQVQAMDRAMAELGGYQYTPPEPIPEPVRGMLKPTPVGQGTVKGSIQAGTITGSQQEALMMAARNAPAGFSQAQLVAYLRSLGYGGDDSWLGGYYPLYVTNHPQVGEETPAIGGHWPGGSPIDPNTGLPWGQQGPPIATLIGGGTNMAVDYEAQGPFTQYLRAIGLGGGGYQDPGQRYQASMYDPYRNLIEGYQGLRTAMGRPSPDWGTAMAGSFQPNKANIQSQYANLLQGLLGMAPAERTLGGFSFEPSYPYGGGGAPSYEGGEKIGYLQDLIAGGAANRFGQGGAGWLAGRVPALQQQWELGRAAGTQSNTFLDYLRQKYGL